jgi:hypothetical protein
VRARVVGNLVEQPATQVVHIRRPSRCRDTTPS